MRSSQEAESTPPRPVLWVRDTPLAVHSPGWSRHQGGLHTCREEPRELTGWDFKLEMAAGKRL